MRRGKLTLRGLREGALSAKGPTRTGSEWGVNIQLKGDGFILASSLCRPPLSYRAGQQTLNPGPNRGRAGRVGWITISPESLPVELARAFAGHGNLPVSRSNHGKGGNNEPHRSVVVVAVVEPLGELEHAASSP